MFDSVNIIWYTEKVAFHNNILRKVGTTMMNENVKKAYHDLVGIRAILEEPCVWVNEWMKSLAYCVTPLLEVEQYAFFAQSLQQHVESYLENKLDKVFMKTLPLQYGRDSMPQKKQ